MKNTVLCLETFFQFCTRLYSGISRKIECRRNRHNADNIRRNGCNAKFKQTADQSSKNANPEQHEFMISVHGSSSFQFGKQICKNLFGIIFTIIIRFKNYRNALDHLFQTEKLFKPFIICTKNFK